MSAYIQIPLLRETAQKRPLAQEKEPNFVYNFHPHIWQANSRE